MQCSKDHHEHTTSEWAASAAASLALPGSVGSVEAALVPAQPEARRCSRRRRQVFVMAATIVAADPSMNAAAAIAAAGHVPLEGGSTSSQ